MSKSNITVGEAARCLRILEDAEMPMFGADLGRELALAGSRETRRRHVREIIKHLRDNGSWIVGDQQQGYWLTREMDMWRDYLEGRQIDAKRILAETHRRKKQLADARGQGVLFDMRVRYGVATAGYRG